MKSSTILVLAAFVVLSVSAMGCGGAEPSGGGTIADALAGAPDWVIKSCSTYWDDDEDKRICGVGSAGGSRNISLMRTTAIARARTEIARSLGVRVKSMLADYAATTTGGEEFGTAANDEQHIVDVSKQITDLSLAGTEMVESWIANDGTLYALVGLDLAGFKDAVARMDQLSEAVRQAVVQRAEKAFDDLDEEIDKKRTAAAK